MFASPPNASKALPKEYRGIAEKLFPPKGFSRGRGPSVEAAKAFAEILGIGDDYKRLWNVHKAGMSTRQAKLRRVF